MRATSAPLLVSFLCLTAAAAAVHAAECKSTVSGDLRIHSLTSKVFDNTRSIRVLVPPGYDAPENRNKRYPVLYLLDGQNLFDACLSDVSHAEWQIDETVYRLIREKAIPQLLVVGIDHAGVKRPYEFLPYRDHVGNPDMEEPAGRKFPDFLATEVLPFVNERYRTLTGHGNTGIGGSSYGGVATRYSWALAPRSCPKAREDSTGSRCSIRSSLTSGQPATMTTASVTCSSPMRSTPRVRGRSGFRMR